MRRGFDRAEAEEAVQEAFIEALRALERGAAVRDPRAWFRRLLLRTALRSRADRGWRSFVRIGLEVDVPCVGGPGNGMEVREEAEALRARLRSAMATWPEPYASILRWRFEEGRTVPETAARLMAWARASGFPLAQGSAERWVARARRTFLRWLSGEGAAPRRPRGGCERWRPEGRPCAAVEKKTTGSVPPREMHPLRG